MQATTAISAKWRLLKQVLGICVLLTAVFALASSESAADEKVGFGTRAKAAFLMDADTGAILYQHNADELLPPASITKLMTAELVFQAIKDGRMKLEDELPMSVHAWRTGGAPSRTSSMFVPVNTNATVNDLLRGMIVQSANDAAIAFAEGMAGTEEGFASAQIH